VIVLREGKKLYEGRMDELTSSFGIIEVQSDNGLEILEQLLEGYDGIDGIKNENNILLCSLSKNITASKINQYLFNNGIAVSHLRKRKPTLEQQFLDLTKNK